MGFTPRESEQRDKPEDRPERAALGRAEALPEPPPVDWSKELQSHTLADLKLPHLEVAITNAQNSISKDGKVQNQVSRVGADEKAAGGRATADSGKQELARAVEKVTPGVKTNAAGYVTDIVYDQNKSRQIIRDEVTNEAKAVITLLQVLSS